MELRGSLRNFPLPDIIQLVGMGRRSGVLAITLGGGERASIFFNSGEMIHAEFRKEEGAGVIYSLFKLQDGNFQFTSGVQSPKRSIDQDWMTIVMEAARRYDEERERGEIAEPAQGPQTVEEKPPDLAEVKRRMGELLDRSFGRKAKKMLDELERVEAEPEKLLEFCNKAEKFIFVFIDNRKAKGISDKMRELIKADRFF